MADVSARDAKLIQYLNEAWGKEKELETALQAHISMTTKDSYRKRLQEHLKETKSHAKQVERRIKQLGGRAEGIPSLPEPAADAALTVQSATKKVTALAKGPLHAIRGTGEQEKLLKNAKTEYFNEAEEIATYSAIETLAEMVGDKETAKLVRGIKRDEERMLKFLEGQITQLTKAVAREEIPASERTGGKRRRQSSSRSRSKAKPKTKARTSSSSPKRRSRSSSRSRSSGSSRSR